MKTFKVGDWVRHPNFKYPAKIMKISDDEISIYNKIDDWLHIDIEFEKLKLWTPYPYEWCWFWDYLGFTPTIGIYAGKEEENFLADIPSGKGSLSLMSFKYCQPLIGELPSHLI